MNRETRDKFATRTLGLTTGNAVWETAPAVFAKLNADFGPFDVDLTADAARHHCPIWFGPDSPLGEFDALTANWHVRGERGFSNPPYGPFVPRILRVAKAQAARGFTAVMLLPVRITRAFHSDVLCGAAEVHF